MVPVVVGALGLVSKKLAGDAKVGTLRIVTYPQKSLGSLGKDVLEALGCDLTGCFSQAKDPVLNAT